MLSKHSVLITRIFDDRVKSFVKNYINQKGKDKIRFSNYCYRVEFQARGLPHIHGALWIDKEWLKEKNISGDFHKDPKDALKIINMLLSVSLPEEEPLKSK